jgi:hypothetical protein
MSFPPCLLYIISRCHDVAGAVVIGSGGQVVWLPPCLRYVVSHCRDVAMQLSWWRGDVVVVGDNELSIVVTVV